MGDIPESIQSSTLNLRSSRLKGRPPKTFVFFHRVTNSRRPSKMSGKAKETASNTMEAILKKMLSLKNAKEAAGDNEKALQNRVVELNALLKAETTRSSNSAR